MPTASNVSTGKPKIEGGIYVGPLTATLPTSATTALTGFANLGYVSEDGVTNSNNADSTDIGSWGGAVVGSVEGAKKDTFQYKLIEVKNIDVLKAVYGDGNVSGTLATGITIKANNAAHEPKRWVIDMLMSGGDLKRICIPAGTVTQVGDIVYKDDEASGYELTITCAPDASGQTHYEYITTPTTPSPGAGE